MFREVEHKNQAGQHNPQRPGLRMEMLILQRRIISIPARDDQQKVIVSA
jgi:hypothetical protein